LNLLLYGVVALAILGTLGGMAYKIRESGYDSCKVEWTEAAAAQTKREQELSAFAAKALALERAKRKVVTKERTIYVDREITKLVESGTCFTPLGVCNINSAISGKGGDSCKPDGTMPAARPSG
jgi:hypothetical protein